MRILIVEDDFKAAKLIARGLMEEGFKVEIAGSVSQALDALMHPFDLMILDWMLPDEDGLSLCIKLRKNKMELPILMLTAKNAINDKVSGLNSGADDYLAKPFAFDELLARVNSLLRRQRRSPSTLLSEQGVILNLRYKTVMRRGHAITLSPKEFDLLELLMLHSAQVISRKTIAQRLWQQDWIAIDNLIDVNIKNLRQKLELPGQPKLIHTLRGEGFIFEERASIEN